jgi:hypothetical protein
MKTIIILTAAFLLSFAGNSFAQNGQNGQMMGRDSVLRPVDPIYPVDYSKLVKITYNSGSYVTGNIISDDGTIVKFVSQSGVYMEIAKSEIKSIDSVSNVKEIEKVKIKKKKHRRKK